MLVIIDVKPKDLGLPTEAYISVEEIHDVSVVVTHLDWKMFVGRSFVWYIVKMGFCDLEHDVVL